MAIIRTIKCSVCKASATEKTHGAGFPGWGALQGVALDDEPNPTLCPTHLGALAEHLDNIKNFGDL